MIIRPRLVVPWLLVPALLSVIGTRARADATQSVVVIPVGTQPGFGAAVASAKGLVDAINKDAPGRARLIYPAPATEAAAVDVGPADDLQAKAMKAFKNLDFPAVQKDARTALKTYKDQVKGGGPVGGYVATLHLIAAAALFDGDQDSAFKAMNDAVLFAETPPERTQFNPTVQQFHRKVLDTPASTHTGHLRIDAPPGALVWLDRKLQGAATGLLTGRAGLHLVQVFAPGHKLWLRWFRIKPGATRDLSVKLAKTAARVPPLARALAEALDDETPSRAVRQAERRYAAEVLLVGPGQDCSAARCPVQMRWAVGGAWKRSQTAVYLGDGERTASELMSSGDASKAAGGQTCTVDSQCGMSERCVEGRCERPRSIFRKWWFWTAVGVAAAAATVAIVVPLSRPDGPVIEIR